MELIPLDGLVTSARVCLALRFDYESPGEIGVSVTILDLTLIALNAE
jgi:hypothetical protein